MKLAGKSVLITGGAGFIGSHLVEELSDCRRRILDDFSTGQRQNLASVPGELDILQGDVRDDQLVAKALEGIDIVFHLACRGVRHSIGNPQANHEVNASGTLTLLRAAHRLGIKRLVHVSSSEVYGSARQVPMTEDHPCFPETVYGAAKLAGEAYARAYHRTYQLPIVVVRPFNNFGPRSHYEGDAGEVIPRFVVWALNGKPPVIFGDGKQTRDFLYVKDTAYWLRRIAEADDAIGQTINLGSGIETSILELATIIYEEANGRKLQPSYLPPLREGIRALLDFLRSGSKSPAELLAQISERNWTEQPPTPR
jgi:UDP-glucose 4-epimerase